MISQNSIWIVIYPISFAEEMERKLHLSDWVEITKGLEPENIEFTKLQLTKFD